MCSFLGNENAHPIVLDRMGRFVVKWQMIPMLPTLVSNNTRDTASVKFTYGRIIPVGWIKVKLCSLPDFGRFFYAIKQQREATGI